MQWPLARHLQVQVEYTAVADRSNEYARLGFTELWKFQDFVGSERQVAEIPGSRENGLFRIRNARVVGSNPIPGTIQDSSAVPSHPDMLINPILSRQSEKTGPC